MTGADKKKKKKKQQPEPITRMCTGAWCCLKWGLAGKLPWGLSRTRHRAVRGCFPRSQGSWRGQRRQAGGRDRPPWVCSLQPADHGSHRSRSQAAYGTSQLSVRCLLLLAGGFQAQAPRTFRGTRPVGSIGPFAPCVSVGGRLQTPAPSARLRLRLLRAAASSSPPQGAASERKDPVPEALPAGKNNKQQQQQKT